MTGTITMQHGSGGSATGELIREVFAETFQSEVINQMEDAAVVEGCANIAITTDSFVVTPLIYSGGDIGRLAVCGTVNDLLSRGATPKYLTCGFILEEGTPIATLKTIVRSMAETAREAGVKLVAGDTKVIEGSSRNGDKQSKDGANAINAGGITDGGIYINTAGVGFLTGNFKNNPASAGIISAKNARPGDKIIVTGNLGDHHAALLAARMEIETDIKSDNAPLCEIVEAIRDLEVHTIRDITRGGLATVLKELAETADQTFVIESEKIPVDEKVQDFCGILGLDPLYMGNEGKMAVIVAEKDAEKALANIKKAKYGENAKIIGEVTEPKSEADRGALYEKTAIGGLRSLSVLQGEGLPRIC